MTAVLSGLTYTDAAVSFVMVESLCAAGEDERQAENGHAVIFNIIRDRLICVK